MPAMLENMKAMKTVMLTMYSTQKGLQDQQNESQKNSNAMGKAFDASKNDDSFYLPPEIFNNAEFKKGMKNFIVITLGTGLGSGIVSGGAIPCRKKAFHISR